MPPPPSQAGSITGVGVFMNFGWFDGTDIEIDKSSNFCYKIELFTLVLVHCVRLSCPVNLVKTDRTKEACPGTYRTGPGSNCPIVYWGDAVRVRSVETVMRG